MLNIDAQNNITLTRGDTLTLTVTLLHEVDPENRQHAELKAPALISRRHMQTL